MTALTGTVTLTRLALRRDRTQLSIWLAALTIVLAGMAAAISNILGTEEDIAEFTEFYVVNPTVRLFGLASGASVGGFIMIRGWFLFAILAALISAMAVVRHTRQNEDTRRAELISSAVVGRHASLTAALILAAGLNVVLALLLALALIANDLPVTGSLVAGSSIGAVGVAFAGVAAVTAQLSSRSRGATGLAAAVLGVAVLLAGIGNMLGRADEAALRVNSTWPAWLSPFGWGQQMRPYHDNNWWVLGLFAIFFAATVATAFVLAAHRDVGRGMIAERSGPAVAPRSLLSPIGLAWRLQRGVFLGWAAGVVAYGVVIGAIASEVEDLFADLDQGADIITRLGGTDRIIDAYFATIMGVMGTIVSIYALQVLLRMRSEEEEGPLESILATRVSRVRWTLSFIAVAALGSLALLLLAGLSAGIASGITMNDVPGQVGSLLKGAAVQAPATFVIAGFVVAAFGLLPRRAAAASWGIFFLALVLGPQVGELLDLPAWLRDASPFSHTPLVPATEVSVAPIAALAAIAIALAAAGVASFRRRDLAL